MGLGWPTTTGVFSASMWDPICAGADQEDMRCEQCLQGADQEDMRCEQCLQGADQEDMRCEQCLQGAVHCPKLVVVARSAARHTSRCI
jgi:predicted amidophosphoribosyltransferase